MSNRRSTPSIVELQQQFTDLVHEGRLMQGLALAVRHLPACERDDRVAEGMAVAWRAFLNKARRTGILLTATNLGFVARAHARDPRLRLVGGTDAACCLSPPHHHKGKGSMALTKINATPAPLHVRHDLMRLIALTTPAELRLLEQALLGHTFAEIARSMRVNRTTTHRRLRALGPRLLQHLARQERRKRGRALQR